MVAIVSGNSLGLNLTSLGTLGQKGVAGNAALGQAGERIYVNSANGNLVVQDMDELLVGRGPDIGLLRTYNSQGILDGDNNDQWRIGVYKNVVCHGLPNAADSTVSRTDADGAESLYTFDGVQYNNTDGGGAYDRIKYDASANAWTWMDGDSQVTEKYDSAGRMVERADADGNHLTYAYNGDGLVTKVTAANGEITYLEYVGKQLMEIGTAASSSATRFARVNYSYDGAGRLHQVKVDLTPEDHSDNKIFVTTYTYDDQSTRVASISHSDGTTVSFAYKKFNDIYRVETVTDALGKITRFEYISAGTSSEPAPDAGPSPSSGETSQNVTTVALAATETLGHLDGSALNTTDTATSNLDTATLPTTDTATSNADSAALSTIDTATGNLDNAALSSTETVAGELDDTVLSTTDTSTTELDHAALSTNDTAIGELDDTALGTTDISTGNLDNAVLSTTDTAIGELDDTALDTTETSTSELDQAALSTTDTIIGELDGAALSATETRTGNLNNSALSTTEITDASLNDAVLTTVVAGWGAAALRENLSGAATAPQVTYDRNGNGMAVWALGTNLYVSRYIQESDSWSAPITLDGTLAGSPSSPQLSMSANGNALVTWIQNNNVYARRYVNGLWDGASTIPRLENAAGVALNPVGAINDAGRAIVAFVQKNGARYNLLANIYNGKAWRVAATNLDDKGAPNNNSIAAAMVPSVALDAQNNATVLWLQKTGKQTVDSLYFTRFNGKTWSKPNASKLENTTIAVTAEKSAFDANGNGLVTWLQGTTLYAKAYIKGSNSWGPAITLSTTAMGTPSLSLSGNGHGLATWVQGSSIYARRYADGAWIGAAAELLETGPGVAVNPVGSVNDGGQAAVVFVQNDGTRNNVYSNRFDGTAWAGAVAIEGNDSSVSAASADRPSVAIDADGNINSLWLQKTGGAANHSVYSNHYNAVADKYHTIAAGATWESIATALYGTGSVATQLQTALGNPALTAGSRLTGIPASLSYTATVAPYYTIGAADTWESIATTLYGTGSVATQLQSALGDPALTAGNRLTGIPASLSYTATVAPYYTIGTADTWESIATTLYGTATAAAQLQTVLGNPALSAGSRLTGIPAHLTYPITVAPYYTIGAADTWESIATALYGTGSVATQLQTALGDPALIAGNRLTGIPAHLSYPITVAPYYTIGATDTWESIAATLYGEADLAAQLQASLGNPPLGAGSRLTGIPATLSYPITVAPYYTIGATDTWESIAAALYGSTSVAAQLQAALGNPALIAGDRLTGIPATLSYTVTVAPYYTIGATDTWESIAAALFGDANVAVQLQTALGDPALIAGNRLTGIPAHLSYPITVAPYYTIGATDTWESIAAALYGAVGVAAQLQAALGNPALTAGDRLTGIPATLSYTVTVAPYYTIGAADTWESIAAALYGSTSVAAQLQAALGNPALTAGDRLTGIPATLSYTITVAPYYTIGAADTWESIAAAVYGNIEVAAQLQAALGNLVLSAGERLTGIPATLSYTVTVAPYYTIGAADTWESIAASLYGAGNAAAALQTALGNPALTAGDRLTGIPAQLSYAVNVPAYYEIPAGATWESIAIALYGAAGVASQLQTALGDPALNTGSRLTNLPSTLLYSAVNTSYVIPAEATWASIAIALYGDANVATQLQAALGDPPLTAGSQLSGLPSALSYTTVGNGTVPSDYIVQAGDTWASIALAAYGDAQGGPLLQAAMNDPVLSAGLHLNLPQSLNPPVSDTAGMTTNVIDPLGNTTSFITDAQGRLTELRMPVPASGAARPAVKYGYYGNGDIQTVTDARGNITTYDYDAHGNQTLARDVAGNTITRTYSDKNELLTETAYRIADSDGAGPGQPAAPMSTRYAYDGESHLRFIVSAAGRVTEYRYNGFGEREAAIEYVGNTYAAGGNAALDTGALEDWITNVADKSKTIRTDYKYDFRGQLDIATKYSKVDGAGVGMPDGQSITKYVYDQAGNLLQQIDARGTATPGADDYVTNYTYDGLGRRQITSQWVSGQETRTTLTQYDDANNQIITTLANGLSTISVYDGRGNLTSTQQKEDWRNLGLTRYTYDDDGRLRRIIDPTEVPAYMLYDGAGRKTADIDGNGELIEYRYDLNGQLTRTIRYATALDADQLASLFDGDDKPRAVDVASFGLSAAHAQTSWIAYDGANRPVKTVDALGGVTEDALGGVTETRYDGAGRITDLLQYFNTVSTAALVDAPAPDDISPAPDPKGRDRRTRYLHDADGKLVGTLDAEGYLSERIYDAAGQCIEIVGYTNRTNEAKWNSTSLADWYPEKADNDNHSYMFYDASGQLASQVDGAGHYTETIRDQAGNATQVTRYWNTVAYSGGGAALTKPSNHNLDQTVTYNYDGLNRLTSVKDAEGIETRYTYDSVGNLIKTVREDSAQPYRDTRTLQSRYDIQGRLIGELSGEGSAALAALTNPAQAAIDQVWADHGVRYAYDSAGRRISAIDPNGHKTRYYYDRDGLLTVTVNALGEVSELRYNALDELVDTVQYATRIDSNQLDLLSGGLADDALTVLLNALAVADANSTAGKQDLTRHVYDNNGRLVYTVDAVGNVSENVYDAYGQITCVKQYAKSIDPITLSGLSPAPSLDDIKSLIQKTPGKDLADNRIHDKDGRLRYTVDGMGGVVLFSYDGKGNLTERYAYANKLETVWTPDQGELLPAKADSDQRVRYRYDALNRVQYETDGAGAVTRFEYDSFSNVISKTAFATKLRGDDPASISTSGADRVTRMAYDDANRLRFTVDTLGGVARRTYDGEGNLVQIFEYETPYSGSDTSLSALENWSYAHGDQSSGRVTRFAYDKNNRQVLALDADYAVTETRYDAAGNAILTLQYSKQADSLEGTGALLTPDEILGSVDPADATNRITRRVYDAANRPVYTIDAENYVTETQYDALGQITATIRYPNPVNLTGAAPGIAEVENAIATAMAAPVARTQPYTYLTTARLDNPDAEVKNTPVTIEPSGTDKVVSWPVKLEAVAPQPNHATVTGAVNAQRHITTHDVTVSVSQLEPGYSSTTYFEDRVIGEEGVMVGVTSDGGSSTIKWSTPPGLRNIATKIKVWYQAQYGVQSTFKLVTAGDGIDLPTPPSDIISVNLGNVLSYGSRYVIDYCDAQGRVVGQATSESFNTGTPDKLVIFYHVNASPVTELGGISKTDYDFGPPETFDDIDWVEVRIFQQSDTALRNPLVINKGPEFSNPYDPDNSTVVLTRPQYQTTRLESGKVIGRLDLTENMGLPPGDYTVQVTTRKEDMLSDEVTTFGYQVKPTTVSWQRPDNLQGTGITCRVWYQDAFADPTRPNSGWVEQRFAGDGGELSDQAGKPIIASRNSRIIIEYYDAQGRRISQASVSTSPGTVGRTASFSTVSDVVVSEVEGSSISNYFGPTEVKDIDYVDVGITNLLTGKAIENNGFEPTDPIDHLTFDPYKAVTRPQYHGQDPARHFNLNLSMGAGKQLADGIYVATITLHKTGGQPNETRSIRLVIGQQEEAYVTASTLDQPNVTSVAIAVKATPDLGGVDLSWSAARPAFWPDILPENLKVQLLYQTALNVPFDTAITPVLGADGNYHVKMPATGRYSIRYIETIPDTGHARVVATATDVVRSNDAVVAYAAHATSTPSKGVSIAHYFTDAEVKRIEHVITEVRDSSGTLVSTARTDPKFSDDYTGNLNLSTAPLPDDTYTISVVAWYKDGSAQSWEAKYPVKTPPTARFYYDADAGSSAAPVVELPYTINKDRYEARIVGTGTPPADPRYIIQYHDSLGRRVREVSAKFSQDPGANNTHVMRMKSGAVSGSALGGVIALSEVPDIDNIKAEVWGLDGSGQFTIPISAGVLTYPEFEAGYQGQVNLTTGAPLANGRYKIKLQIQKKDPREAVEHREFGYDVGPAAGDAAAQAQAKVQVNRFYYDAAGRLASSTDAEGKSEDYTYDGLGNKKSFTNKNGDTWEYDYDANGRLVTETSAAVDVTTVTEAGDKLDAGTPENVKLKTRFEYDALGNLTARTEAHGRAGEARTTQYEYDALGRQTGATLPTADVYDHAEDLTYASAGRTETAHTFSSKLTYDALGNAVSNRDAAGHLSYKAYDALGQVRYDVDATGAVTGYQRDAFGQVTQLVRYADIRYEAPATPIAPDQLNTRLNEAIDAAVASDASSANRKLETKYDRLGRTIEVTGPEVYAYDPDAADGARYFTTNEVTRNIWNAFGDLTQQAVLKRKGGPAQADPGQGQNSSPRIYSIQGKRYPSENGFYDLNDADGNGKGYSVDAEGNISLRYEDEYGYGGAIYDFGDINGDGKSLFYDHVGALSFGVSGAVGGVDGNNDGIDDVIEDGNGGAVLGGPNEIYRLGIDNTEGNDVFRIRNNRVEVIEGGGDIYYDANGKPSYWIPRSDIPFCDINGNGFVWEPTSSGDEGSPEGRWSSYAGKSASILEFHRDHDGSLFQWQGNSDGVGKYVYVSGGSSGVNNGNQLYDFDGGTPDGNIGDWHGTRYFTPFEDHSPSRDFSGNFLQWISVHDAEGQRDGIGGSWYLIDEDLGYVATKGPEFVVAEDGSIFQWQARSGYTLDGLTGYTGNYVLVPNGNGGASSGDTIVNTADVWTITNHYYDKRSQESATVDAMGYLSTQRYDAEGNLIARTEYANQIANWNGSNITVPPPASVAPPTASGDDRTVLTEYDRQNRKTSEIRKNVAYTDASGNDTRGDVVTGYGYDAVGNLTRSTDALGNSTISDYDALGRVQSVTAPTRPAGSAAGVTLTPLTTFHRDAFGNVVEQIDSATVLDADGATVTDPANDRITLTRYDSHGNAIRTTHVDVDASGKDIDRYASYDARGQVAKQWQQVSDGFDANQKNTLFQAFTYDALGRRTGVIDPASSDALSTATAPVDTRTAYNAFGEVTQQGIAGAAQQTMFDYDNAGRIWRTNSGDGVEKVRLHDLQGHQTAELRNATAEMSPGGMTNALLDTLARSTPGLLRTDTRHDALGRIVQQTGPARSSAQRGGESFSVSVSATASIAQSAATPGASNKVTLSWAAARLADLGAGDIRVELDYRDTATTALQQQSNIYSAEAAAKGIDFIWTDKTDTAARGIAAVHALRVYKKDLDGNWQPVLNRSFNGQAGASAAATVIHVIAPTDPQTKVKLEIRLQGSGESGWLTKYLMRFGDAYLCDLDPPADATAGTQYEYRVSITAPNQTQAHVLQAALQPLPPDTDLRAIKGATQQPVVNQTLDRWGNVLSVSDPRAASWITRYAYNANNQLVRQAQPDDTGAIGYASPVTRLYYDRLGQRVAVQDARGNRSGTVYDAGGNLVEERHADGGTVHNSWDAFGNKTGVTDAKGKQTGYRYDKLNRLTQSTSAEVQVYRLDDSGALVEGGEQRSLTDTYTYDEAGRRIGSDNGAGRISRTQYDLRGNVIATRDDLAKNQESQGQTQEIRAGTRYGYDALNRKIAEQDANGNGMTWQFDGKGRLLSHTDLGGVATTYDYNFLNQVMRATRGQSAIVTYGYDEAAQLIKIEDSGAGNTAGDNGHATVTDYAYDLAGRRVREKTAAHGPGGAPQVVQDNHLQYDSLGRLADVADSRYHIRYGYDANGNRQHVKTSYINGSGEVKVLDSWNTYDEMNRQTIADGVKQAQGVIVIDQTQGHAIGYDANGNRTSDTYFAKENKLEGEGENKKWVVNDTSKRAAETYEYDALNRLIRVTRQDTDVSTGSVTALIETDGRQYDAASRAISSGLQSFAQAGMVQGWGLSTDRNIHRYDAGGRLLHQTVYEPGNREGAAKVQIAYDDYDPAGNLRHYMVGEQRHGNEYAAIGDGYRVTRTTIGGGETTRNTYDLGGNLIKVSAGGKTRSMVNDAAGRVLLKSQDNGNGKRTDTHTLLVNGELIGSSNNGDTPDSFGLGYEPITAASFSSAPGSYVARAGDTLHGIAKATWGDASLWYLLAEANGLPSDVVLAGGEVLTIPARATTIHNNSDTFQPYDPSKAVEETMPLPMPSNEAGCGGLGAIIMAIVVIAVALISQQYYLINYGSATVGAGTTATLTGSIAAESVAAGVASWTTGSLVAGGAIGGAVGSIAGQIVGNAIGVTNGFDWKQVALGALGGGIGGGLAGMNVTGGAAGSVGNVVARAAIGNTLTQGIGAATGLQPSFSWRGVAAASVGAGVGSAVGGALGLNDPNTQMGFGERLFKSSLTGFAAGATTAAMRGGRISVTQIATTAFGDALGSSIASANLGGSQQEPVLGATFADDMAARRAANYWNPMPEGMSSAATFGSVSGMVDGFDMEAHLRNSERFAYAGASYRVASSPLDNRALLNAAERRMNPDYYATFPNQISTSQRMRAHALGVYDAGVGVVESASYSFGVVGTPESRAAWAVQTSGDAIAGIRRLVNDPEGTIKGWWNNLAGDDPAAIRQATTQGAGVALSVAGGVVAGRLNGVRSVGGGAYVNGMFVHDLTPTPNLQLYGTALARTPDEAVQILRNAGHDPQMLAQYHFVKLSDADYAIRASRLGYDFDASYGLVPSGTSSVSFGQNIASRMADGSSRTPVYVRRQVFESDEAIVQTLSHEIFEIEELRYLAARPISVSEYRNLVRPDRANNLHFQAVQEGDAWLQRFRGLNGR